jgi:rare lipoprotein A
LALGWTVIGALLAWPASLAHARTAHGASAHSHPTQASHGHSSQWIGETGTASYYGKAHHGRRTAGGTRFDQQALTAAHPWLPFGTRVRVTLDGSDRSVVVVVTDRLYSQRRIVDLSLAAARHLGFLRQGLATVSLTPV